MKYVISGTNRPNSRSLRVAQKVQEIYRSLGEEIGLIDLRELPLQELDGSQYGKNKPEALQKTISDLIASDGIILVCPEYNGSYPGALKYFIDHWDYPVTFEARPICFIGIGGKFGGVRPCEHLQQVFAYRNAYIFPERVFFFNVWTQFEDDIINDSETSKLLKVQAQGFQKFAKALAHQKLDSVSRMENAD